MGIPITLILTPIATIWYFPKKSISIKGIQDLVEYMLFSIAMLLFCAMGQCCEMVIEMNWKNSALEALWNDWYDEHYTRDCFENGEEIFRLEIPPECAAKNEAVLKKLRKDRNPFQDKNEKMKKK